MEMDEILTVAEVAQKMKSSENMVRKILNSGELKGVKKGKKWFVLYSDLMAYVKGK